MPVAGNACGGGKQPSRMLRTDAMRDKKQEPGKLPVTWAHEARHVSKGDGARLQDTLIGDVVDEERINLGGSSKEP